MLVSCYCKVQYNSLTYNFLSCSIPWNWSQIINSANDWSLLLVPGALIGAQVMLPMLAFGRCNILHVPFWDYIFYGIQYVITKLDIMVPFFFLFWCMFVYVWRHACMHACINVPMEARHWHWASSSIAFYLSFWDTLSHWTWDSLLWLVWLEARDSLLSRLPTAIKPMCCHAWLLCMAAGDSRPHVVQQGLYWLSHLCSPDNVFCASSCGENAACSYL